MDHALTLLIAAARTARDRQAAALLQARSSVQQAESTAQRLRDFRVDCLARSAAGRLGTTSAGGLQDYQRFVGRLDEAVVMQGQQIVARAEQVRQQEERLQALQQRLLALEALASRRAQQRQAKQLRQEQRDSDEFAARALARMAAEQHA